MALDWSDLCICHAQRTLQRLWLLAVAVAFLLPGSALGEQIPLVLHAEVVSVAYGEQPCDKSCTANLAHNLQGLGPVAAVCSTLLEGLLTWPEPKHSWLSMLHSHLPVWQLLRRTGFASEDEELWTYDLDLVEKVLMPSVSIWIGNVQGRRKRHRGFHDFLKRVKRWPSLNMQAEMLLLAANSLRRSLFTSSTVDGIGATNPPPEHVLLAEKHFIELANNIALNATGGKHLTPRLLGLLQYNEQMRISSASFDFISRFLPRNAAVIFAGAHTGTVLRYALKAFPEGMVYAFEADPFFFNRLTEINGNHPNLHLEHAALYSSDGQVVTIRTRNGLGSQSTIFASTAAAKKLWPQEVGSLDQGVKAEVRTVALAPWAKRIGLRTVDFIYLDVECAEMDVLRGSGHLLRNVTALFLEVSNVEVCEGGHLWPEVERFLRRVGFRTLFLPKRPWKALMDIVAIRMPLRYDLSGKLLL